MEHLTIKDGDLFLLTDSCGNIEPESETGLYSHDTRYLDMYTVLFNGAPLSYLHCTSQKNYQSTILLTNAAQQGDELQLPAHSIEAKREQIVHRDVFYERITFINYTRTEFVAHITVKFGSHFQDLFEIEGVERKGRGRDLVPAVSPGRVDIGYEGLDHVERRLILTCKEASRTSDGSFTVDVLLPPARPFTIEVNAQTVLDTGSRAVTSFGQALNELKAECEQWLSECASITTNNELLNSAIDRGLRDLNALMLDFGYGPFPAAGIPWFSTLFGRDSLITALQLLPFNPAPAIGVLRTLAHYQGKEKDSHPGEQPGKILHELRRGEMAALGEIPYGQYYGSIDSTPLFLILAAEYYRLTGDRDTIEEIFPAIARCIEWMQSCADPDEDGYTEYSADEKGGLSVQSWKDSPDSLITPDGQIPTGPMAVSEVQGYMYLAKAGAAEMLTALGKGELAGLLRDQARVLKTRFNRDFWMPEKSFFAIALDGEKRQVRTVTSDIGQCLWTGIIDDDKVAPVAERLMAPDMFSGWGIRTMSGSERVYNPISYHNGSIWAHDNSLILWGLVKAGRTEEAGNLAAALIRAAGQFSYSRLPELFCGHDASLESIAPYPVSCSPQAWAAGTPLAVVQAILDLSVDLKNRTITLRPSWPDSVDDIQVRNLAVGSARISFRLSREHGVSDTDLKGFRLLLAQPLE
jgi:glycogen debranching enzyme